MQVATIGHVRGAQVLTVLNPELGRSREESGGSTNVYGMNENYLP